jgi:WxcM-like, C-terminal
MRHRLIDLPVVPDHRGNLTFIEGSRHIPFDIERVFYLYDVPGGQSRAGHALKDVEQAVIAVTGSFDAVLDDGSERSVVTLNRSYVALYLPSLVWRELENFSSGAVCLVLASARYSENSYYRDYKEFRAVASAQR